MSVYDGGDDIGGNPERDARDAREGKDITDPAGGRAETRGGENPADWTGPLPEKPKTAEVPPGTVRDDWCGQPGCGGD